MDNLQAAEELVRKHEHRLEIEAPAAIIEKILQALAEQIYDHDVVVAFDAIPTHARNANWRPEIGERRWVVRRLRKNSNEGGNRNQGKEKLDLPTPWRER
jgi:hypothetical protein